MRRTAATTAVDSPLSADVDEDLRSQRKASKDTAAYNRWMKVFVRTSNLAGAERIYCLMAKRCVEHNETSHALIAEASAVFGDVLRVECWIQRIFKHGFEAGPRAHTVLVDAFTSVGETASAQRELATIRSEMQAESPHFLRLVRNAALSEDNPIKRVEEIVNEMKSLGVLLDHDIYNVMLGAHAGAGDWSKVDKLMKNMSVYGIKPSADTYATLVKACSGAVDTDRAHQLMRQALQTVKPSAALLNAVLRVFASANDPKSAELWLNSVKTSHPNVPDIVSFNTVIAAYAKAGKIDKAEDMARLLPSHCRLDNVTYTSLIRALVPKDVRNSQSRQGSPADVEPSADDSSEGAAEEAYRILDKMTFAGVLPDTITFNAALYVCASTKNLGCLWRIYDKMMSSRVPADATTYTTLALVYARCGDVERVEDMMHKSMTDGHDRGTREYDLLLSAYGNAWPRDSENAERTIRAMVSEGVRFSNRTEKYLAMAVGKQRAADILHELQHLIR